MDIKLHIAACTVTPFEDEEISLKDLGHFSWMMKTLSFRVSFPKEQLTKIGQYPT